jgi:geranylgeranylglycerol-phosphate geranylgeranyltransferase
MLALEWNCVVTELRLGVHRIIAMEQRRLSRISAFLKLARPQIALQGALYMVLGAYIGVGLPFAVDGQIALAALVVALIVAFGFVINDYADYELDRRSKPHRLLPMGEVALGEALQFAKLLALLALITALSLPLTLLLIAVGNLALTALYSLRLKRTVLLGNIAIAILNSSVLLFGALAGGVVNAAVISVASMSLLYTVAQEILYTVDDHRGDAEAGIVTTAGYFGVERSLVLFRSLITLAALAALLPWWGVGLHALYLVVVAATTILPILVVIVPLTWRADPGSITRACKLVKLVRVSSMLPLLLLPMLS